MYIASITFDLFFTFMKVGLFTFGGGYAMISMIEYYCVGNKRWLTHDEMMSVIAVAESTPGPIAINCATFTGYKQAGLSGAIIATLGMILPSFIILYVISIIFENFMSLPLVVSAFRGIKVAVGLLILNAGLNILRKMSRRYFPLLVVACSCCVMLLVKISSIVLILVAGVTGLLIAGGKSR